MRAALVFPLLLRLACSSTKPPPEPKGPVRIAIIGTTDWHGHVEKTAVLAGYLKNLRAKQPVILVDAGDLFQGTLESNPNEGASVITAFNLLGYDAAAIGNHEFDFGPAGPESTARRPDQDPRGALKARAAQARFPLLAANIVRDDGKPLDWPNVKPATIVDVQGVKVGIIGVSTMLTPSTTIASNFKGLKMVPMLDAVTAQAKALRGQGAKLVIVAAHAGGGCQKHDDPKDLSSCKQDEEVMHFVRGLAPGLVDVVIAGHTHQAMAHEVNGIPVIEAYANGRAFGRVDVVVDGEKKDVRIVGLQDLCAEKAEQLSDCKPGTYEGEQVILDQSVLNAIGDDLRKAKELRERSLGVEVTSPIKRSYGEESALGNLVADVMKEARPGVDAAITNGGGLRADIPAGTLTYGAVYEALPFDNRFATVTLTGAELRRVFEANLGKGGGILVVSGINVLARCEGGQLHATITRDNGLSIPDDQKLTVATSDFLASGGDGVFGALKLPEEQVVLDEGEPIRESVVKVLEKRGGTLGGDDPRLFSTATRRIDYQGKRPITCR